MVSQSIGGEHVPEGDVDQHAGVTSGELLRFRDGLWRRRWK
jgi:hypothetical protein